ncbi:MAG TPA: hypothetical protein DCY48_04025 [Candidatus Magasanikbacteria bacterium]|nr:hypothetical protein [Candidatus Magasanikbacteria bacterium]
MMLLTMPSRHSFITTERYDLCCILRLATQKEISAITAGSLLLDSVIQEKIRRHQQKYFWKLNSYTSAKYVTTEDFTKELEGYSTHPEDIGKTIQEYERLPEHLEKKRALLQKISNVELIDLLRMQDTIFQIHDRRKECLTISVHYLDFLLAEIAKRAGVPIEDARYTRISELEDLSTMKDELAKRRTGSLYVLLQNASEYLFAGEEAKQLFHLFQRKNIQDSFVSSAVSNSKQLKGNCASLGKACGRVKVCRGEKEIANVEVGDILVACMTQPEYVPAMKKAAAVITDEGGLNCHAAIICRELGIPCLVGTATATHVLKDGMRVEVDATRGIVTIL